MNPSWKGSHGDKSLSLNIGFIVRKQKRVNTCAQLTGSFYTVHGSCLHIPNWSNCTFQLLLFYSRCQQLRFAIENSVHIHHLCKVAFFLTRYYALYIIYDTIFNRAVKYNLSLLIWISLKVYYFTWTLGKTGGEAEISCQEDGWDMVFEITQR